MTSVLDQLNIFKYSKEVFLNEREKMDLKCSDALKNIIEIINSNIKKSISDNQQFSNSFNNSKNNFKRDKNTTSKCSKSWRMTKTSIIPKNISKLDKQINEINALLNKMTSKNYDIISKKIIIYYNTDDSDILVDKTINNIFMKAVMQPYCPDYVKFLKILSCNQ